MAFVPMRNFGVAGVIQDTPSESLPVGTWSDALNVRFTGGQIEKMLESGPVVEDATGNPDTATTGTDCRFMITWTDGFSSYLAAVFRQADGLDYVYRWDQRSPNPDATTPAIWEQIGGPYAGGPWQGFQWGNTFIINNGTCAPQIFDRDAQAMIDLPNWGKISTANDITTGAAPSKDTQSTCRWIGPLKNYLVALNVQESGDNNPNKVWWSDPAAAASIDYAPLWDYTSPATLSGQTEVGVGAGNIVTAKLLNDNLIIYTDADATALSVVGGRFVMQTRRLFNKGAAGLHTVEEFENKHFVIARDQIYVHDGSTPQLIAQDRVEREFYKRIGKKDGIDVY